MATIVLVPGFWLGAWAWDEVAGQLRAAGHDVHAVTLTGLAERSAEATPEVDVDTHIADVIGVIERGGLRDVVLVGHSGANMPVTGVGDRIPGRLRRLVYVDTGPMPDGLAQIDFLAPQEQEAARAQVAAEGDGWLLPVRDLDQAADPVNLAGIAAEDLARFAELGTPEPFGAATQAPPRPAEIPDVPASLIACTFTPDQVRQLAATGNPIFSLMAGMDMHHLPTGHWPMFSRPKELAVLIDRIAQG